MVFSVTLLGLVVESSHCMWFVLSLAEVAVNVSRWLDFDWFCTGPEMVGDGVKGKEGEGEIV